VAQEGTGDLRLQTLKNVIGGCQKKKKTKESSAAQRVEEEGGGRRQGRLGAAGEDDWVR